MISEPSRRISSLSSPTALSSLSPRNELLHTSSASLSVLWTAVGRTGRISYSVTGTPVDGRLPRRFGAGQPSADDVNAHVIESVVTSPRVRAALVQTISSGRSEDCGLSRPVLREPQDQYDPALVQSGRPTP